MRKRGDWPNPAQQVDPLEADPTETKLVDPTGGIDISDDFHEHEHQTCPVNDPRAADWQEHSFYWWNDFDDPTWQPDWIFELARFAVPPGHQGIVSILETAALGITGAGVRVVNENWQYPESYMAQCDSWPGHRERAISFYLRLESWKRDSLPGAPRTSPTRASLPGIGYPPLGEWWDTRYDFARGHIPVSMTVSEGHWLTLWAEIVTRSFTRLMGLWGRLGGITQTYRDNPQAIDSARSWRPV